MRWDELFADLEAQAHALAQEQRAAQIDEQVRAEIGATSLFDRLRAAGGTPVRLDVAGALTVHASVSRVGADWLLLNDRGAELIVTRHAVLGVAGLGRLAAVPGTTDALTARLGLWFVLRRIARDRSWVRLHRIDGSILTGTVDRAGADFADLAIHAEGEARRRAAVRAVLLVPYSAIAAVRRVV
jgi:hypothetical protein